MSKSKQYLTVFLTGGTIYAMIEVLTRGYTHWSMLITAGVAMMIIYHRHITHENDGILTKCFYGCIVITLCEFTAGVILNLILHWNIWDYSNMYLNILGQICPTYMSAWFLLSLPAAYICEFVRVRAITANKSSV